MGPWFQINKRTLDYIFSEFILALIKQQRLISDCYALGDLKINQTWHCSTQWQFVNTDFILVIEVTDEF